MTGPAGLPVAYCGSDLAWAFLCRALVQRPVVVRRYADDQPRAWTTGRFDLIIVDVATGDGHAVERLRRVSRWRGGSALLVLYGLDAGGQAVAARVGGDEGVIVRRLLPGVPGEERALAQFVEALLERSPAACTRMILRRALGLRADGVAAFGFVVVDRLAAGEGLPRREGSRVVGMQALARAARTSLRSLEATLRETGMKSPARLAGHMAVLYTALLACSRDRSLEWAAGHAGLSAERVRRWRRSLGLSPGLLPDEVVATSLRVLAERCELPSTQLTELVRRVAVVGENRARTAGA